MECTKLENEKYKGVIIDMGKKCKNTQSQPIGENENQTNSSSRQWMQMAPFIFSLITCIIVVGTFVLNLNNRFDSRYDKIEDKIDKCLTVDDISQLKEDISQLKDDASEMYKDIYNDDGKIQKKIQIIYDMLDIKSIETSKDMSVHIDEASIESNDTNLVTSPFESTTCIGTDADGNTYVAEDLIGETILLTYAEGDEEVYFLGQYNENYNWDGYCVTNSYYSDGRLMGICESNFDNGKRLDYKSFVKDDAQWIYSDRICSDDSNVGMNETYDLNYEKVKNFTNTNVRVTDILYVDKFIEANDPSLKELYHGDTADSLYNDDSGNAYYISLFDDGTVKTLYQGNFKDGKFNDNTGNAWYIVKDIDTDYMYFKGSFENNSPVGQTDDNTENPIDLARINEIIQGKNFDCELKWATT